MFHASKTAKMIKVISLSSTLTPNFCGQTRRLRDVPPFWHDGDMSSTACRRRHVYVSDDTTWQSYRPRWRRRNVDVKNTFVCDVGILTFNFRVFVQRRRVVDDVSSSPCRCRRRRDISSTLTIDIKTLRYTTRLHDMLSFWHCVFVQRTRLFVYRVEIASTQRLYRHFFIAWHSAIRYHIYLCTIRHLSRLGLMTSCTTSTFLPPPGEQFYSVKLATPGDLTEK